MTRHRSLRRAGIAGMTALSTACYQYQEVQSSPKMPSESYVRVELTDAGSTNVAKAIGPYIQYLEGPVASADESSLSVRVASLRRRGEADTRWTGDLIRLDRNDMRAVNARSFSRGRTAIAASIFTGLGLTVLYAIAKATGLVSGSSYRPPISGT